MMVLATYTAASWRAPAAGLDRRSRARKTAAGVSGRPGTSTLSGGVAHHTTRASVPGRAPLPSRVWLRLYVESDRAVSVSPSAEAQVVDVERRAAIVAVSNILAGTPAAPRADRRAGQVDQGNPPEVAG